MPEHLDHEETVMTYISSEHATSRSEDGSRFTINMDNSVFVEKTSGMSVSSVSLPNVFPNINSYRNTFQLGVTTVTIPVGQYTATEIVTLVNIQLVAGGETVTMSYDGTFFTFTNSSGVDNMSALPEVWDWLGWNYRTMSVLGGNYILSLGSVTPEIAPHPSALFGEKVVHICCDKLGHGNMVHGADGKLSDVMVTIPMGNTAYHAVAAWETPGDSTYRINYKYVNSITSSLAFSFCDSKMRSLSYPPNHHVQMMLKIYHQEHH
jgi:hypothetical protein